MDLDATVRARLEAATKGQDIAAEDKGSKAEKAIWAQHHGLKAMPIPMRL